MKSELQKAADRIRKLQQDKPAIVENMKAANNMLGVREQEMEQAALNLRTAEREAHYAESACKENEHKLAVERNEVRILVGGGGGGGGGNNNWGISINECMQQATPSRKIF